MSRKLDRKLIVKMTHFFGGALTLDNEIYCQEVLKYTFDSFRHDLEPDGDITSQIFSKGGVASKDQKASARIVAKSSGVLAGVQEIRFFLEYLSERKKISSFSFQFLKKDADQIQKGDILMLFTGKFEDIVKVERNVLNLLQRMSGVATLTSRYVEKAGGQVLITPTRKTLWGLLDKRACVLGGGGTHRLNLCDAMLIKDTHLDLVGRDFEKVFDVLLRAKKIGRFVEIEVENGKEAFQVAQLFFANRRVFRVPFFLMFDNMKPEEIRKALVKISEKFPESRFATGGLFFEASGGVTLKNIRQFSTSGVDVISVGALTHSAQALDISLKITK